VDLPMFGSQLLPRKREEGLVSSLSSSGSLGSGLTFTALDQEQVGIS
jgi:hypothetical protein